MVIKKFQNKKGFFVSDIVYRNRGCFWKGNTAGINNPQYKELGEEN